MVVIDSARDGIPDVERHNLTPIFPNHDPAHAAAPKPARDLNILLCDTTLAPDDERDR
jgi:hypothetical protein